MNIGTYTLQAIILVLTLVISVGMKIAFRNNPPKPEFFVDIYTWIPTILLSIWLMADRPIMELVIFCAKKPVLYFMIIIVFLMLENIGGVIDSLIVKHAFTKEHRGKWNNMSLHEKCRLIKYGVDGISGRYDWQINHLLYAFMTNFLGALIPFCLLLAIRTLPEIEQFVKDTKWLDFIALIIPIAVLPGILQARSRQIEKKPECIYGNPENPDNYMLDRFHVMGTSISLLLTLTMVILFGFFFLTYAIVSFRQVEISILFILPIIALSAFLSYLAYSELAYKYGAIDKSAYKAGRWILMVLLLLIAILFRFSFSLIVVIGMSVMILSGWDVLIRKISSKMEENPGRNVDTRWILTITVLLFALVIIMSFLQVTGE